MADEEKKLRLEIAHILFIDIVGYSTLLVDEQHEQIRRLNEIVRSTDEFRSAEEKRELIRLPTGDGMALVFLTDPEAPVQCAVEIAKALKSDPRLQLRMGIHSGPVNQVSDVNERANVAGAGMNMAQRVMDCGDAGHILLSKANRRRLGAVSASAAAFALRGGVRSKTWPKSWLSKFLHSGGWKCGSAGQVKTRRGRAASRSKPFACLAAQ